MAVTKISHEILEGNCDEPIETVRLYAQAVRDALTEAYPGAEINVEIRRNTSGAGRRAGVVTDDESSPFSDDEEDRVADIIQSVWESDSWRPADY